MLNIIQFEKEVVTMINKAIYSNSTVNYNLTRVSSITMSKTLYDSPTLMEIIFS